MSKSYDRYVEDEMDDDYSDPEIEDVGKPKEKTMNMKNSVTVNRKAASSSTASDLKIGQIGIATSYPNEGAVILCTYDGFVDLKNPNITWQVGSDIPEVGHHLPERLHGDHYCWRQKQLMGLSSTS